MGFPQYFVVVLGLLVLIVVGTIIGMTQVSLNVFHIADVVFNRVSLKTQNIFLRPGDLIPTVFRYEDTKKPISNV